MGEGKKITEAEVSEISEEGNEDKGYKKISTELIMIFFIGFLFGIAVKTEFSKRINVVDTAFYGKQGYDFSEIQAGQSVQDEAPQPGQPN